MEILNTYIAATNTHNFEEVQKVLHKDAVYFFLIKPVPLIKQFRLILKMLGPL